MTVNDELLPCPFCGSKSLKFESKHHGTLYYIGTQSGTIRCMKCKSRGPTYSVKLTEGHFDSTQLMQGAVEKWNFREERKS